MRSSKTIVRPGEKNGGTTIVLKLARPTLLQVTVVRMRDCERIARYNVRAHRGVNRIPFRGRVRGRALPEGAYRLVFRARGSDAYASVTVVVARGKPNAADLRRARRGENCEAAVAATSLSTPAAGTAATGSAGPTSGSGNGDPPLVSVAKGVTKKARAAAGKVEDLVTDSAAVHPILVVLFGLTALASAALGLFVAVQLLRQYNETRLR